MRGARARASEEGSATVLAAVVIAVLCLSTGILTALTALTLTRHRAQAAADLAAVSAAKHALEGEARACGVASSIAGDHRARLDSCRIEGLDVLVTVTLAAPGPLAAFGRLQGTARAGVR